ncbi:MAG: iron-sulfur cluster assembly scaffold protein [bacterium]
MYTEKVLQHFKNPHNQGVIKDATVIGQAGNKVCGDVMKLYLKVDPKGKNKEDHVIKDIKFETLGCAAAIAISSILTDMVKGKTIREAKEISKQDIVDGLGGLPPIKVHCSMLAVEALNKAFDEYLDK